MLKGRYLPNCPAASAVRRTLELAAGVEGATGDSQLPGGVVECGRRLGGLDGFDGQPVYAPVRPCMWTRQSGARRGNY